MKICLNEGTALSTTILKKILEKHKTEAVTLHKLEEYYKGRHDILQRTQADITKPNHKIVNPYPQYITDTLVGYFMGEPITYTAEEEGVDAELSAINTYNSTASVDADLAKAQSVFGTAYELHYIDPEDGNPYFTKVDSKNMIIIYNDKITEDILYAIRLIPQYDIDKDKRYFNVDVYSDTDIKHYTSDATLSEFTLTEEEPHYYGMVPVAVFKNNEQEMGDYETIIPLIDAYDILESDALNEFDYFVDSYLVLRGMTADSEDIAKMKNERVLLLDDDGEASWLIKSENDSVSENLKNRFKNDIHKFAKVPDLSDENFSSNASGVAMKYKLFGTETVVATKERYFRDGINRRLELLFNILNLKGGNNDWRAVEVQFTRNVPTNETEVADLVSKLQGIVSTETLLAQIPFITDVKGELERLEADVEKNPFYDLGAELGDDA